MARPEDTIQKSVLAHIASRGAPGLVCIHVPNAAKRNPRAAAALRGLGMRKGASDLLLWHGGKSFALELKADSNPSAEQLRFLQDMQAAGATVAVARGEQEALSLLEDWQLLRGVAP